MADSRNRRDLASAMLKGTAPVQVGLGTHKVGSGDSGCGREWRHAAVGAAVGVSVSVDDSAAAAVGVEVGAGLGAAVGASVNVDDSAAAEIGAAVGAGLGAAIGRHGARARGHSGAY